MTWLLPLLAPSAVILAAVALVEWRRRTAPARAARRHERAIDRLLAEANAGAPLRIVRPHPGRPIPKDHVSA